MVKTPFKSFIYVYTGQCMSKHTWDDQATSEKTRKNKKQNSEKVLKKLWISRWESQNSSIHAIHTCERVHFILSKTVFKKYFLRCALYVRIASFHGIFKWRLLSKTTLVERRKQRWTKILTQFLFSCYCLVCINIVPGQYLIQEIFSKIYHQAHFINIFIESDVEFLGIPLLPVMAAVAMRKKVVSIGHF